MEIRKISRRPPRSEDEQNLVISRRCFAENGKERYKMDNARAQLLFC